MKNLTRFRPAILAAVLIYGAVVATSAYGQSSSVRPAAEPVGDEGVAMVLRVSRQVVRELLDGEITMELPVDRVVGGIPTWGSVAGAATPEVDWATSPSEAAFTLSMSGVANASLQADVGPAIAAAGSETQFTIKKQIRFDGRKFVGDPTRVETASATCVHQVCAKRGGLIGKLISCIGLRMARQATAEINTAIDETAQEMLIQYFDDECLELIAELNQSAPLADTLEQYFPETKSWRFHLATSVDYLLVGVGPPGSQLPRFPEDPRSAPVELWIKTRPSQAAFVKLLVDWNVAQDLLVEFLGPETGKRLAQDLTVVNQGGWTLLRLASESKSAP